MDARPLETFYARRTRPENTNGSQSEFYRASGGREKEQEEEVEEEERMGKGETL